MTQKANSVEVKAFSSTEVGLDRPANYYLVKVNDLKLLIDAGPKEVPYNEAFNSDYIILTHFHWDHVRGIVGLSKKGIPVCASRKTVENMNSNVFIKRMKYVGDAVGFSFDEEGMKIFKVYLSFYNRIGNALEKVKVYNIDECPGLKEAKAKVYECPGHSDDHICLTIGDHLFIGDNTVPGGSVTLIDVISYMKTASLILSDPCWSLAHPGHGKWELTRLELGDAFYNEVSGKMRRISNLSLLINENWKDLKTLLFELYRGLDKFTLYIATRSLVGYIEALERMKLIEVDRSSSPWRVRGLLSK